MTYLHKQTGTIGQSQFASLWFSPTGDTFSLVDSFGPFSGGAPAVLADKRGDVYWLVGDDSTSNLRVRKYSFSDGQGALDRQERIWPGYVSTKWTAMYAEHWDRIFVFTFFPAANNFSIFNSDLSLFDSYQLTQNGSVSGVEYPHLAKDQDEIIAAWTTTPVTATSPFYDDIRYVVNNFGGGRNNWYAPQNGNILSLPIVSDSTGPSFSVRPSFISSSSGTFLAGCALTNRLNAHFAFESPNGVTATDETEVSYHHYGTSFSRIGFHDNLLQGGATSNVGGATLTIQSLDGGYFKGGDGALYLIGASKDKDASGNQWINVLKSTDDGVTWQDFAQSSTTFAPYAINVMREGIEVTGGWANADQIFGVFTHITTPGQNYPQQVYSFRIPI